MAKTIADRLTVLMDGRDKYPWARSIGIDTAIDSITRMGRTPGGDTLSAILRCENARIDWLLDGRGSPYTVTCAPTDDIAAETLQELLEEKWHITVISDGQRIAVVLDQPGAFEVKDKKDDSGVQKFRTINYNIIEVIVGTVGRKSLELIRPMTNKVPVHFVLISPDVMSMMERGKLGTWRILQAPGAVTEKAQRLDAKHPVFSHFNQQELFPASPDEKALLGHYRAMTPENRLTVDQVATAMAEYKHAADVVLKK